MRDQWPKCAYGPDAGPDAHNLTIRGKVAYDSPTAWLEPATARSQLSPAPCADPEGGPGVRTPPPPPWDLSEVGSCVDIWWVRERVQRLFYLTFIIFFWLAPLASIIYSLNIWKIGITFKFKGISLLPSYTLSLALMNVPFPCLFCLKRFYTF